jgi:sulfide:quinone oxidoreductase
MSHHKQILIVGGGNAGISAAAQLLRKNDSLNISIIEPSDKHYYQPAWTLVAGGEHELTKTVRQEKDVIPEKVNWIQNRVESFQPEQNQVTCADHSAYTYDYLIVAPGIQLDWHRIKGAKETLGKNGVTSNYVYPLPDYTWKIAREFKGGNAIFTSPDTPIKCGGAPLKIMYLLSDYFRKNNLLEKTKVQYYSGGKMLFGVKKYADTLEQVTKRYGIQTHFKHNLIEVKGEEKIAVFETKDTEGNKKIIEQPFDLLHIAPPQSAPDFVKFSPLAIDDKFKTMDASGTRVIHSEKFPGWVDVDKHTMQHVRYKNIFSCGDATSTPNAKTGAAVRKQVPVMVENIFRVMENKPLFSGYNGYGSCPLITGYGKLVMAEFDYDKNPVESFPVDQGKERWTMWAVKKYFLPWFYWNRILTGRD